MGIYHDEDFWEVLLQIRTMFVTGRLGSGKTLLCFAVGQRALQKKYIKGIMANINHSFAKTDSVANSMVVVDEAWQIMDNRYSVDNFSFYGAWSRKTNTIWGFPSVYGIDKRVRGLQVERIFDLAILPIRIWIYKYASADGRKGWFMLTSPEKLFGTYSTKQAPINDGGALDSLMSLLPEGIELVQKGRGKGKTWNTPTGSTAGSIAISKEFIKSIASIEERVKRIEAGRMPIETMDTEEERKSIFEAKEGLSEAMARMAVVEAAIANIEEYLKNLEAWSNEMDRRINTQALGGVKQGQEHGGWGN